MFSAKGADSYLARRGENKLFPQKTSAESANQAFPSIPNIAFVEFDTVFAQEIAILLLKTAGAMVLFLILHVFKNGVELTRTH